MVCYRFQYHEWMECAQCKRLFVQRNHTAESVYWTCLNKHITFMYRVAWKSCTLRSEMFLPEYLYEWAIKWIFEKIEPLCECCHIVHRIIWLIEITALITHSVWSLCACFYTIQCTLLMPNQWSIFDTLIYYTLFTIRLKIISLRHFVS